MPAVEPRYIADGFKEDCMTLLTKFAGTNSARFADFVKVWKDMKFSMIYCGLSSFAELLEFTEEALNISKQLFLPPNPDISRVGALYLVYGVYTQQPTRGLVKIRMTPDDWSYTIDFIANIREFGYADANFIFHLLCYYAAFTFTACDKEYGLERTYRRHHLVSNHVRKMMYCKDLTTNQILEPVFDDIDIEALEKSRIHYENCKSILAAKEEKQGMEFTSMTPSEDIVSMLRRVVDSYIPDKADADASNTAACTSGQKECNPDVPSSSKIKDIGKDRQGLKKRAFKLKRDGQNHLKSCLSTTEATEGPSTSVPSKGSPEGPTDGPPEMTVNVDVPSVLGRSADLRFHGKVYEKSIFCSDLKRKTKAKTNSTFRGGKNLTKVPTSADLDRVEDTHVDDPDPPAIGEDTTSTKMSKGGKTLTKLPTLADLNSVEDAGVDVLDPLAIHEDETSQKLNRGGKNSAKVPSSTYLERVEDIHVDDPDPPAVGEDTASTKMSKEGKNRTEAPTLADLSRVEDIDVDVSDPLAICKNTIPTKKSKTSKTLVDPTTEPVRRSKRTSRQPNRFTR